MGLRLKLGGSEYRFFTRGTVNLKYAHAASTFTLSGVFDIDDSLHRKLFKPLSYPSIQLITDNDEVLITGTVTNHQFHAESEEKLATISGYGATGVLQDCQISTSSYPLEFNGLTLREIVNEIVEPFNIPVIIENDGGVSDEPIEEVTASTTQSVLRFLTEIASQRNLIITSTPRGELLITRLNTSSPSIATYREGVPGLKLELSVNGQNMHSDLTIMKQQSILTDNSSEETVNNPLISAFRPSTSSQDVGTDNTAEDAVKNVRANELKNIVMNISSDRWEWTDGRIVGTIVPNNIIDVISPKNFLSSRTRFFVESVTLILDEKKEVATLQCVLPEVYNNQDPEIVFS